MNDSREKIKIVLKRSGLSQIAFAKKIGISESYVSKLLKDDDKKDLNGKEKDENTEKKAM